MVDESGGLHLAPDGRVELRVSGLVEFDGREEVVDEGEEEGFILVNQLREVHVAQNSHHDRRLRVVGT